MTQERSADSLLPAFCEYEKITPGYAAVLRQFRTLQPVHAYLLSGARGLGKRTFARYLAASLYCTQPSKPCGYCDGCRRFFTDQNPDATELTTTDKAIGVDDVRGVVETVSQHAFGAGYRVVLVEPVEKMTPQAQNALLKSLEEPAAQVVFLLLSHDITAVLPTIVSRCCRVQLLPWRDEWITQALQKLGYEPAAIAQATALCSGNIGQALQHLSDAQSASVSAAFVRDVMAMCTDADVVRLSTRLKEDRGNAGEYLDALEQAVYRLLLRRAGRLPEEATQALPEPWQKAAEQAPMKSLNELLHTVMNAKRLRAAQVNWQANIDLTLIRFLEEVKKWQTL